MTDILVSLYALVLHQLCYYVEAYIFTCQLYGIGPILKQKWEQIYSIAFIKLLVDGMSQVKVKEWVSKKYN